MAAVNTTLDASWLGVSSLTWTATRGGSTLATAAATIDGLDVSGTLDLSAASLGALVITLADSGSNVAWEDNYILGEGETLTIARGAVGGGSIGGVLFGF